MKQVLLRITGVFAEIGFAEFTELPRRHFLSTRKIMLSQNPLDPDVDWECAEPVVGKEHHAICDFRADARKVAKFFSKIDVGK